MLSIDRVRYSIVVIMESLVYIKALELFLEKSKTKLLKLYITLIATSGLTMVLYIKLGWSYHVRITSIFICFTTITIVLLGLKPSKAIFLTFIYAALILAGDIFAIHILIFVLKISVIDIHNEMTLFFLSSLISLSFIFLLLYILKYKLLNRQYSRKIRIKNKNIILHISIVGGISVINFYIFLYNIRLMNPTISTLHMILVVAYIITSLNYSLLEKDLKCQERLYKSQEEHLKIMERLLWDYRELKHGWRNYLLGFAGFIYAEKIDRKSLISYYESVVNTTNHLNKDSLSMLIKLKNNILVGMFVEKINEIQAQAIDLNINILGKEIKLQGDDKFLIDMNFILGNFLDNAIRYSLNADVPIIWIAIEDKGAYTEFIIKNTFKPQPKKKSKDMDKGYGLKLVEQKAKKYSSLSYNTLVDGDVFKQEILIDNESL